MVQDAIQNLWFYWTTTLRGRSCSFYRMLDNSPSFYYHAIFWLAAHPYHIYPCWWWPCNIQLPSSIHLEMSKQIDFVCLGTVVNSRYSGHHITWDHSKKTIKISQADLISNLLEDWGMKNCKPANMPLSHKLSNLPPCSPNACNKIPDQDITILYQCLIGSITYLAICTWPDIAYAAINWVNTMLPQLEHI